MKEFKVGDKVTVPAGGYVTNPDDSVITLSPDDVGTIISINNNESPLWPVSFKVDGKPVECWDDKAWHLNFDELQLVN